MHILVLNFEFPPLGGGAAPACEVTTREYVSLGYKTTLITTHFEGLSYEEKQGLLNIHRVDCGRKYKHMSKPLEHLRYIAKALSLVRQIHKQDAFDVCHCHFILPTGVLAWMIKKQLGIPYLITLHGSDVPGYNPDRFEWMHRFLKPFTNRIVKNAFCLVSPSDYLAALAKSKLKVHRLERINYGFNRDKYTPGIKRNIILSTGRFLPRKGFLTLLDAAAEQDLTYEIHLCGDGPLMPEIREKAAISKTRIVLHGWLDNRSREFLDLLAEASIFVLLSGKENSSVSLMEAMASSCAVISSNTSGCLEMVGDVGFCLPENQSQTLRTCLQNLIAHPGKQKQSGEAARKKIEMQYDPLSTTKAYINLLQEAIRSDKHAYTR